MKSNKFYFGAFVTFLAFCLFFFFFFGFKSARAESKKSMNAYRAAAYTLNYSTTPDATTNTTDYSTSTASYTGGYSTDTASQTRYGQDTTYAATDRATGACTLTTPGRTETRTMSTT